MGMFIYDYFSLHDGDVGEEVVFSHTPGLSWPRKKFNSLLAAINYGHFMCVCVRSLLS